MLGGGAHRELVHVGLAQDRQAGRAQPGDDGGVVRRHPALEDPRAAGRGQALGGHHVLDRDRHAVEGRRGLAARAARVGRGGLLERALGVDVQERVHPPVDLGDPVRCVWVDLDRGDGRRRRGPRPAAAVSRSLLVPQDPRHAEPLLLLLGRPGERLLGRQPGHHDVLAEDVGQRQRVGGRRDVVVGDVADGGDRLEDHRQLGREVVELGVGQVDPGEVRQVRDLVPA